MGSSRAKLYVARIVSVVFCVSPDSLVLLEGIRGIGHGLLCMTPMQMNIVKISTWTLWTYQQKSKTLNLILGKKILAGKRQEV